MKNKCPGNCKQRVYTGIEVKYVQIVLRSDLCGVQPCYYEGQSIERVNENECNFPVKCHHSIKCIKGVTSCPVIGKELRQYYESLKILVRTQMRLQRQFEVGDSQANPCPPLRNVALS